MTDISEGTLAPNFDLPTDRETHFELAAHKGRIVVVYFYPKDDTSGCTVEAKDFSCVIDQFAAAGATVVGISPDKPASKARFRAKYDLAVELAADEDKAVCQRYGVWIEKSMYGRKYMGVDRSTFLVDRKGRIARVWQKVKVPGHAEEVLAAVKSLKS